VTDISSLICEYAWQFFAQQVVEHYYWLHRKSYSMQYCSTNFGS